MKINRIHVIFGILLVLIPLSGVTQGFKNWFSIITGCIILYFAMRSIHDEITKRQNRHRKSDSFVESRPHERTLRTRPLSADKVKSTTPPENTSSPYVGEKVEALDIEKPEL